MATQKELFPWSPFPMYSGLNSGEDFHLLSAYLVDRAGKEIALEQVLTLRPKYEYRWRLEADEAWSREITPEEIQKLTRFGEIFKEDLAEKTQTYGEVRFYLEYWKQFSGTHRYQPDQRRMILEYALH